MPESKHRVYIPSDAGVILRSFGTETLLFHAASGDTLLLNPTAVPLIERLQQGSIEKSNLFEYVAEKLNYELDACFVEHMEDVLSGLINRDIVAAQ